jgi:hypothetical protein
LANNHLDSANVPSLYIFWTCALQCSCNLLVFMDMVVATWTAA